MEGRGIKGNFVSKNKANVRFSVQPGYPRISHYSNSIKRDRKTQRTNVAMEVTKQRLTRYWQESLKETGSPLNSNTILSDVL